MSETKHTPGPWRISEMWRPPISGIAHTGDRQDGAGNVFWGYSISGSNEHGADILPTLAAVHNFPTQIEANARLIAAAPDMLEALKGLVAPQHTHSAGCSCPWCFARAAIEKAEGRS